mgnify:CR=1 FL=1
MTHHTEPAFTEKGLLYPEKIRVTVEPGSNAINLELTSD